MKTGDSFFDFAWNFAIRLMVLLTFLASFKKTRKISKNPLFLTKIDLNVMRSWSLALENGDFSHKYKKMLSSLNSSKFDDFKELSRAFLAFTKPVLQNFFLKCKFSPDLKRLFFCQFIFLDSHQCQLEGARFHGISLKSGQKWPILGAYALP